MRSLAATRGAVAVGLGSLLLLSGCAHLKPSQTASDSSSSLVSSASTNTKNDVSTQSDNKSAPPAIVVENGQIIVRGMKLKNTKFDFPITVNSRVEYWLDYFCGRGRHYFATWLERSEFFIPYIKPLLKQSGAPEDLVYLAMIESGFSNHARSQAKAVGPWQFISATGKRYGLMVNWWVDERRDIRKSTLAAIDYLKELNGMFQSWELAAAAYNAGEAKIARAIRRYGTKDFWVLARQRFLRQETRDYVPKIIAAALIGKNPTQFGFPAPETKPAEDEAVAGNGEIVKVIKTDKPEERLAKDDDTDDSEELAEILDEDGPSTGPEVTPATLTVPADPAPIESQVANNEPQPLAKPVPTPHVTKKGEVGGEELAEFEVQSPADLLKVARAAGLSYQTVKSLNPELLRWCTPPNVSSYRIKLPASTKERFLVTYNHVAYPRKVTFLSYKVRRGETLSRIAKHFGIRVDPISDLNGVSPRMPLRGGIRVLLPIPNDRSRSLASLEIRDPPEKRRYRRTRRHYKVPYRRRESARSAYIAVRHSEGDT